MDKTANSSDASRFPPRCRWSKKRNCFEPFVSPEAKSPEDERTYQDLLAQWNMVAFAQNFKPFVIHEQSINGHWVGSGHRTWADFCREVLRVNVRTALRMRQEGAVARKLLAQIPGFENYSGNMDVPQILAFVMKLVPLKDFLVPPEKWKPLTDSDAFFQVACNRKLLRLIRSAVPEVHWVGIVKKAVEFAKDGRITVQAIRQAVAEIVPSSGVH